MARAEGNLTLSGKITRWWSGEVFETSMKGVASRARGGRQGRHITIRNAVPRSRDQFCADTSLEKRRRLA